MTAPSRATVSKQAALTVPGNTVGFCDATTSTTAEYVDLSEYKGRYVHIECETADHYVAFGEATGFTLQTGAQPAGTAGVVRRVLAADNGGPGIDMVVPDSAPWLGYRAVSATGVIRVLPS